MKKLIALLLALLLLLSATALASDRYDLDDFGYRTVRTRGKGKLVFQNSPRGSFMSEYSFSDGDRIFVNLDWREDGYAIAYENGDYGYVDASYIEWGGDSRGGDDVHDLDNFVYRTVEIDNGGALVFQRTPRGTFMYDHKFYDGDEIFVGRDYERTKSYSEQTGAEIDAEVKREIDEAYAQCTAILTEHREQLDEVATYLLANETMSRRQFEACMNGEPIPDAEGFFDAVESKPEENN